MTDILEMKNLILDKRKDYIFCSNYYSLYGTQCNYMSDADKQTFDREVDLAVKQIRKLIKELEMQLGKDQYLRQDELKHFKLVVYFLNLNLKDTWAQISQLRLIHLKKSQHIRKICRLANLVEMYETKIGAAYQDEDALKTEYIKKLAAYAPLSGENKESDGWEWNDDNWSIGRDNEENKENAARKIDRYPDPEANMQYQDCSFSNHGEIRIGAETRDDGLSKSEQMQLVTENEELFERFAHNNSELERIESNLSEIQRLQNTFAEKIIEQEHDIDSVHIHSITALDNLDVANQFIREAIKNQANRRVIALFCLIVLTFTLLFLDWYNP